MMVGTRHDLRASEGRIDPVRVNNPMIVYMFQVKEKSGSAWSEADQKQSLSLAENWAA